MNPIKLFAATFGVTGAIFGSCMVASAQQQPTVERWPYMLMYPAVQKELNLSEGQTEKVGAILQQVSRYKGEELERRVEEFLNPEQRTRLNQIRDQALMTRGALGAKLMGKLKLSADQKSRLEKVLTENEKQNEILQQRLKTENLRVPGAREKLIKKYYDVARERMLGALTPEQRAILKQSLGQEFPGALELAESL